MPTYVNRSNQIITPLRSQQLRPNDTLELPYYLSLHEHPELEKLSDSPPISTQFTDIFTDINSTTNLSQIYTFSNRVHFKVIDGSTGSNSDGNTVTITIFGGDTDNQADWDYITTNTFTRQSYTDYDGNSIHLWDIFVYPDLTSNPQRHPYRFWSVAVTSISVGGSITLLYRDLINLQY